MPESQQYDDDPPSEKELADTNVYLCEQSILRGKDIPPHILRPQDIKIYEGNGGLTCALYTAVGGRTKTDDDRATFMTDKWPTRVILGAIDGYQKLGGEYAEELATSVHSFDGNLHRAINETAKVQRAKILVTITNQRGLQRPIQKNDKDKINITKSIIKIQKASGCCCAYAFLEQELDGSWWLRPFNLGDSRTITIKDGTVISATPEYTLAQAKQLGDAVHYDSDRYVVMHTVNYKVQIPEEANIMPLKSRVSAGTWVLAYSDGIGHNLTPEEIAVIIKDCQSPKEASEKILTIVYERMKKHHEYDTEDALTERIKKGIYPDGYKGKPVKDNIALAITRIPESAIPTTET